MTDEAWAMAKSGGALPALWHLLSGKVVRQLAGWGGEGCEAS